mmetsp:Transcript_94387/g.236940  ORF Transcript_94387/g.236940 Transcript_94387/m.236940 type:complete len:208 (-) Transcript_94387:64-687(-)
MPSSSAHFASSICPSPRAPPSSTCTKKPPCSLNWRSFCLYDTLQHMFMPVWWPNGHEDAMPSHDGQSPPGTSSLPGCQNFSRLLGYHRWPCSSATLPPSIIYAFVAFGAMSQPGCFGFGIWRDLSSSSYVNEAFGGGFRNGKLPLKISRWVFVSSFTIPPSKSHICGCHRFIILTAWTPENFTDKIYGGLSLNSSPNKSHSIASLLS